MDKLKKIKVLMMIIIIIAPMILYFAAPNNPNAVNVENKLASSNHQYILGTDNLGRCELSRLLYAGKTTISIVLGASIIIFIIGTIWGLLLSNINSYLELIFSSFLDSITAIPTIVYLIIIVGILGNSVWTMLIALTASMTLRLIKFVKTLSQNELNKAYCTCAFCLGASNFRVLFIHVLPNIIYQILSYISLSCAEMIMMISGFSFIGLNLGDTEIDWGFMLNEGRKYFSTVPSLVFYPMFLIVLYAFIFNGLAKLVKEVND